MKSVQLVLRGTDMHSRDILIKYWELLQNTRPRPFTVFKHSKLSFLCHSALQDVHLLGVIREVEGVIFLRT